MASTVKCNTAALGPLSLCNATISLSLYDTASRRRPPFPEQTSPADVVGLSIVQTVHHRRGSMRQTAALELDACGDVAALRYRRSAVRRAYRSPWTASETAAMAASDPASSATSGAKPCAPHLQQESSRFRYWVSLALNQESGLLRWMLCFIGHIQGGATTKCYYGWLND